VLAAAGLSACQAGGIPPRDGEQEPEIISLAAGTHCGHGSREPAARWLDTADAWQAAYRRMNRQVLGPDSPPPQPPDFTRYGILQVFMGQQSTGGYRLRLLQPQLGHTPAGASVRVEWLPPPPGTLSTQVLTSPCLVLAVPRGAYRSLRVTDQRGRTRAVAEL
jgi:hypothetical protein